MNILIILVIAFLIEVVIQLIKPLWGETKLGGLSLTELISMVLGIAIAVFAKLNILASFVTADSVFLLYVFYILTGLAMGRGTSFVHDLWLKLRSNYGDGLSITAIEDLTDTVEITTEVDTDE